MKLILRIAASGSTRIPTTETSFTRIIDSVGSDIGQGVYTDSSKNTYVVGTYNNGTPTIRDQNGNFIRNLPATTQQIGFLCKFNSSGDFQYARIIDCPSECFTTHVDKFDNVYIVGSYNNGTPTIRDENGNFIRNLPFSSGTSYVCKFNSSGVFQYARMVQGSSGTGLYVDSNENLYISGMYNGNPVITDQDGNTVGNIFARFQNTGYMCKFNSSGVLQYSRLFYSGTGAAWIQRIFIDSSNSVYAFGYYDGSSSSIRDQNNQILWNLPNAYSQWNAAIVCKFNSIGDFQFARIVDSSLFEGSAGGSCDSNGNLYMCGQYFSTPNIRDQNGTILVGSLPSSSGEGTAFVCKFNSIGVFQFARIVDSSGNDYCANLSIDSSDNFYVSGTYNGTPTIKDQNGTSIRTLPASVFSAGFMCMFNSSGDFQYARIIDSTGGGDNINYVYTDTAGSTYITGSYNGAAIIKDQYGNSLGTLPNSSSDSLFLIKAIQIVPPLDSLSASALSSLTGTYSLKRVLTSYTGPVINIRRSADNVTSDFYSDKYGNLTTGANGTGTTYTSWIGASSGFVVTWYDQSGKSNHATQGTQASQPTIDYGNLRVNFASPTNAFLQIASPGCIPTGDGLYTCTLKHGSIFGLGTFYGSGINTAWNACDFSYDTGQSRYWGGWGGANDYAAGITGNNNTVTYRYTAAGGALASKEIWVNGVKGTTIITSGTSSTARNSPAAINYIGRSLAYNNPFYANTQINFICIASSSVSDADRRIMEAQ